MADPNEAIDYLASQKRSIELAGLQTIRPRMGPVSHYKLSQLRFTLV